MFLPASVLPVGLMRESELGIEVFATEDLPGIGGKLKKRAEDFVVDEIPMLPPPSPEGRYVVARIRHRNWEANRLFRRLASNLRIGRGKIGFAGTKDGRSVATQLVSFDAPLEAVQALSIPDVEVLEAYTAKRMVTIGDLMGNSFHIVVADLERPDARDICDEVRSRLDSLGGFPNFFGVQRFGSVRPITHKIGRDLVLGDVEGAVMRYVAFPLGDDDSDANKARKRLQETRDFERALAEFPKALTFELMMIRHLNDHPDDYVGALKRLPRNLLMMFVHAYQSYLFNRMLSERVKKGIPIDVPEVGDLVLPLDKYGLPDHDSPILVAEQNLGKAVRNAREGKAFVSGLLYGTESRFAGGRMGEIERAVIEGEGVTKMDFQIVGLREASSKGTRRELLSPYSGLHMEVAEDSAVFRFELNKGCYATAMMREYMKADISRY